MEIGTVFSQKVLLDQSCKYAKKNQNHLVLSDQTEFTKLMIVGGYEGGGANDSYYQTAETIDFLVSEL